MTQVIGVNLVRLISMESGKGIPHQVNVAKLKRAYLPWNPVVVRLVRAADLVPNQATETNDNKVSIRTEGVNPGHSHKTKARGGLSTANQRPAVSNGDLDLATE